VCGILTEFYKAPSFSGLGHRPLTAAARVQIPLGSQQPGTLLASKVPGFFLPFRPVSAGGTDVHKSAQFEPDVGGSGKEFADSFISHPKVNWILVGVRSQPTGGFRALFKGRAFQDRNVLSALDWGPRTFVNLLVSSREVRPYGDLRQR
jgi:hypothetical protein